MRGAWNLLKDWCRGRESNPHTSCDVADFKSAAYVQFRHPGICRMAPYDTPPTAMGSLVHHRSP